MGVANAATTGTTCKFFCNPAGANCGDNCTCRDVQGVNGFWTDCYCLAPGVTQGGERDCSGDGRWRVRRINGAVQPNNNATFQLEPDSINIFQVMDHVDIDVNGDILKSQILNDPDDLQGTFELSFGNGPPDQIPVEIVRLNLSTAPVLFLGQSTGQNFINDVPETSSVQGVFDTTTGIIQFDAPVPSIGTYDLFPTGKEIFVRPSLGPVGGPDPDLFNLLPSGFVLFGFGIPAASSWGMLVSTLVILVASYILFRRTRKTSADPT